MGIVERIEALFDRHGRTHYDGAHAEPVTALAHALQCAQLAEWARAQPESVAAALLHDIGHFLAMRPAAENDDEQDDTHELRALPFLAGHFGPGVLEPIRLHVQAKRYLVATDARYAAALSPASVHSLALQGGPMPEDERRRFDALPFAPQALQLRRWDDAAKEPGRRVPPLGYYLGLLTALETPAAPRGGLQHGGP